MKKYFILFAVLIGFLASNSAWADLSPFWFSTVAYTSTGAVYTGTDGAKDVVVEINGTFGTYTKTITGVAVDAYGVFSVQIGAGTPDGGSVDWSAVTEAATTKITITYNSVNVYGNVLANTYRENFTTPGGGGLASGLSDQKVPVWQTSTGKFINSSITDNGSLVTLTNPLTQSGAGQVAFTGNVDATNGLDVTGADLTVGGTNFAVTVGSGNTSIAGTLNVTGATTVTGLSNLNGGIAVGTNKFTVATNGDAATAGTFNAALGLSSGANFSVTGNTILTGTFAFSTTTTPISTIATSVTSSSTDAQLPTAKAVWSAIDGASSSLAGSKFLTYAADANLPNSIIPTGGNGLTYTYTAGTPGSAVFDVNIDGSTIEIASDVLQVKDAGITAAKLNSNVAGAGIVLNGTTNAIDINLESTNPTLQITSNQLGINLGNENTWTNTQTFTVPIEVQSGITNTNGSDPVLIYDQQGLVVKYGTNNLMVVDGSGNTTISGTLGVTGATTLSSTLDVTGSATIGKDVTSTSASSLSFYGPGNGTNAGTTWTAFKAQTQAGNITYTLPAALPGSGNYYLKADTDGGLTWATASAANVANALTFGDGISPNGETFNGSTAKTISVLFDASLKVDGTTKQLGIDLTHTNTWTGAQTFNSATTTIANVDIAAGEIDGTAIGANSASSGAFTTLTASSTLGVTGNTTLNAKIIMGNQDIASGGIGSATKTFIRYAGGASIASGSDFPSSPTTGTIIQLMNNSDTSALTITGLLGERSTVILQIGDMKSFMYTGSGWTLLN